MKLDIFYPRSVKYAPMVYLIKALVYFGVLITTWFELISRDVAVVIGCIFIVQQVIDNWQSMLVVLNAFAGDLKNFEPKSILVIDAPEELKEEIITVLKLEYEADIVFYDTKGDWKADIGFIREAHINHSAIVYAAALGMKVVYENPDDIRSGFRKVTNMILHAEAVMRCANTFSSEEMKVQKVVFLVADLDVVPWMYLGASRSLMSAIRGYARTFAREAAPVAVTTTTILFPLERQGTFFLPGYGSYEKTKDDYMKQFYYGHVGQSASEVIILGLKSKQEVRSVTPLSSYAMHGMMMGGDRHIEVLEDANQSYATSLLKKRSKN